MSNLKKASNTQTTFNKIKKKPQQKVPKLKNKKIKNKNKMTFGAVLQGSNIYILILVSGLIAQKQKIITTSGTLCYAQTQLIFELCCQCLKILK